MRSKSWWKAAGGAGVVVALALVAARFACLGERPADSLAPAPKEELQETVEPELKLEAGAAPREELVVEPTPSRPELAVLVEDERGLALAGASVGRVADGKEAAFGTTDADGELLVDHPGAARLLARHAGFTPATVAVGDSDPQAVIRLRTVGTISGTVLLESGQPPEGTVRVWASSGGLPPACGDLFEKTRGSLHVAETDASGHFTVAGVDRESLYTVGAAGAGYIVAERAKEIRPDTDDVRLVALPVYGVRLFYVDELGNPLRHGPDCFASFGFSAQPRDSNVKFGNHQELALGGMEGLDCVDEQRGSIALVFYAKEECEKVGPIAVSVRPPGYQSVEDSVWAPRLRGEIADHVIKLKETALGWGNVEVTFVGAPQQLQGEVLLELRNANHRDSLALRAPLRSEPYLVTSVPAGDFQASAKMSDGLFRYPGRGREIPLAVYHDETAKLVIDLADCSVLACEIQGELGLAYTGPVLLRLMPAKNNSVYHLDFDAAPYRIAGVPAGEYILSAIMGSAVKFYPGKELYRMPVTVPATGEMNVVLTRRTD